MRKLHACDWLSLSEPREGLCVYRVSIIRFRFGEIRREGVTSYLARREEAIVYLPTGSDTA
jgi:hypothetical protein